ncbi:MAG: deoxyguanosinetriphosphate triphosphohydrolase [Oscillospiraceae bacterium]|nr:deoxyguanosinetriphosphate triphosphohydrolase [Oscillospiraceae bacterium]
MTPRERTEQNEKLILCEYACFSADSRGRKCPEEKCDIRTDFCRDRDRILHSKSFRRLKQKTQVFLSPEGDHYRTRMTHTLEVSQIARTLARAVRLNEDLTEAIAMGHDLGHTPFGHAGERALNELCTGGFNHYEQSVRVVEVLERDHKGLNLTYETIDGIERHTKGAWAQTLEGRAVRHADRIAFLNHDVEDAETAGVLSESDLPKIVTEVLGGNKSARITTLLSDLIGNFDGDFHFTDDIEEAYDALYRFMFENIYLNTTGAVKREEQRATTLIKTLWEYYLGNPDAMPEFYIEVACKEGTERAVTDYISGMSDAYAVYCFKEQFIPKSWSLDRSL